jgi:ADP-heptose:LPS heptosyltransferase
MSARHNAPGAPAGLLLVVEGGRVADGLGALVVTQTLRRARPDLKITVLAPRPAADLFRHEPTVTDVLVDRDGPDGMLQKLLEGDWRIVVALHRSERLRGILTQWAEIRQDGLLVGPSPGGDTQEQDLGLRAVQDLVAAGMAGPQHVQAPRLALPTESQVAAAANGWTGPDPKILVACECEPALLEELSPSPVDEVREALEQAFDGSWRRLITRLVETGSAMVDDPPRQISMDSLCAVLLAADLIALIGSHHPGHDEDLARLTAALGAGMIALPAPSRWARYVPAPTQRAPMRELEQFSLGTPTGARPQELVEMAVRLAAAALTPGTVPPKEEPEATRPTRGRRRAGDGAAQWPSALRKARKVLVVRPDTMGDVILAGPVIRTLRENMPHSHITMLASPAGAQAAPLLPGLDRVVEHRALWQDLGSLPFDPAAEWKLVGDIAAEAYDAEVILTSFSQTPQPAALIGSLAGIPLRIGEGKEVAEDLLTLSVSSPPDALHQAERSLRLLSESGLNVGGRDLEIQLPPDAHEEAEALLRQASSPEQGFILLSPWSSCPARDYWPERMLEAGRLLAQEYGRPALLVGRDDDRMRTGELHLPDGIADLVGTTTVAQLAALVSLADLVVTANSLILHLADALDRPAVVLYSGTDYVSQWAPRRCRHRALWKPTACRPCYRFVCPYAKECVDVPVGEVVAAGLELLAEAHGGAGRDLAGITSDDSQAVSGPRRDSAPSEDSSDGETTDRNPPTPMSPPVPTQPRRHDGRARPS